jgi:hypothetical protein
VCDPEASILGNRDNKYSTAFFALMTSSVVPDSLRLPCRSAAFVSRMQNDY